jgi:heme/copper-type cytochrome/quinol oxidase subunit 3
MLSSPIVLVQIHASHIILGTLILVIVAYVDMLTSDLEVTVDFAVLYWHLIEVVWLTLITLVFSL